MKIFTNIQDIPVSSRNLSRRNVQETLSQGKGMSPSHGTEPSARRGHGQPRQAVHALTMAKTAQAIVNKAINVSMQIQREVLESFSNSKMDMAEIQAQVSSMNNQLNRFGVTGIAMPSPQNSSGSVSLPVSDITDTMQSLESMVNNIGENPGNVQEQASSILGNLQQHRQNIDFFIDTIAGGENIPEMETDTFNMESASQLAGNTAQSIIDNPVMALQSQGNLNTDYAAELM
ncbi:MAG TPA: hypothetical protein VKQ10_00270 [Spirochaetota bacterium]|nr:hypothetical protein [Spirochaetota bacterium]